MTASTVETQLGSHFPPPHAVCICIQLNATQMAVFLGSLGMASAVVGEAAGSVATLAAIIYPLVAQFSRSFGHLQLFVGSYAFGEVGDNADRPCTVTCPGSSAKGRRGSMISAKSAA